MTSALLEVKDLKKSFGERAAVAGVSFQIGSGESYGLLGPNGAGKTTTISMICGLLRRDSGQVTVSGELLSEKTVEVKRHIGFVPQNIALYLDLSGKENLKFWGKLYGLKGKELESRVAETLEVVGLADRAADRVSQYSGGMLRRLNIAAGMLHHPSLLVLDEPTVGVDPQSRNAILENIESLKNQGMAILYTTHYMEEAERLCDRVGIIDEGRIIAEGTRRELVKSIGQRDRVEIGVDGEVEGYAAALKKLDEVEEVTVSENQIHLVCSEGRTLLPKIIGAAATTRAVVRAVEVFEPDLEAVFLHLTGKALRD